MKVVGGMLIGVVLLAVLLVMAGVVSDWREYDVFNLFEQDYTELTSSADEATWAKAREAVYEKGVRDGRSDSCDALRGKFVDRLAPDYAEDELLELYLEGYETGSFTGVFGAQC